MDMNASLSLELETGDLRLETWEEGKQASSLKPQASSLKPLLPFAFCLLTFDLLFSGCGYHFAGSGALPQGIQRVSVAEIDNQTLETGSEKELQWALEREFRGHGGVTVTDEGEGVLSVTMRQFDLRPLSFDSRDQVLEYEVVLLLDVVLTHRETGQTLWQANNLRVASDYSAVPQVVVTTSPEFQQGTLNPEDLRGLTDIQFSETQKQTAMERLFTAAAREVVSRLNDNF
jgi:outer membrane lipopolysaccharide assembly protein LptE/RlpB